MILTNCDDIIPTSVYFKIEVGHKRRFDLTDNFVSKIAAKIHVSQSEVAALCPGYDISWEGNQELENALWILGLDTNQNYYLQEAVQHRNRMSKLVTCGRYYGEERLDQAWLDSGYASKAAKDKAKNCRMLDELYRQKGLTEDVQEALEAKDFYRDKQDD